MTWSVNVIMTSIEKGQEKMKHWDTFSQGNSFGFGSSVAAVVGAQEIPQEDGLTRFLWNPKKLHRRLDGFPHYLENGQKVSNSVWKPGPKTQNQSLLWMNHEEFLYLKDCNDLHECFIHLCNGAKAQETHTVQPAPCLHVLGVACCECLPWIEVV